MKKQYEEPEMIVRNYLLNPTDTVMTDSTKDPNLNDGDDFNYFG